MFNHVYLSEARDFTKCSFHLVLSFFGVLCSAKMPSKKQKAEVDKQRKLDFFFSSSSASGKIKFNLINNPLGFSISLLNRPVRSGLNKFTEDASGLVVVTCCTLNNFYNKSRPSVTCKFATLIWSSSHSFTRQQIRVSLVSLTHQSYMACIRPS